MKIREKLKPVYLVFVVLFFFYLSVDYLQKYSEDRLNKHLVIGIIFGIGVLIKASDLYVLMTNKKSESVKSNQ